MTGVALLLMAVLLTAVALAAAVCALIVGCSDVRDDVERAADPERQEREERGWLW